MREKLQDPEFAKLYHESDPAYQAAREVLKLRALRQLTQKELADRINTKQHGISRLENAANPPSLSFLQRVADAMDAKLEIRLIPREEYPEEQPA